MQEVLQWHLHHAGSAVGGGSGGKGASHLWHLSVSWVCRTALPNKAWEGTKMEDLHHSLCLFQAQGFGARRDTRVKKEYRIPSAWKNLRASLSSLFCPTSPNPAELGLPMQAVSSRAVFCFTMSCTGICNFAAAFMWHAANTPLLLNILLFNTFSFFCKGAHRMLLRHRVCYTGFSSLPPCQSISHW